MNCIQITGNIVQDPQAKTRSSGKMVVSLRIAVNRKFKGEKQADFFDVSCWGQQAEYADRYARKGDYAEIVGSMESREYEAKGEKRTAWGIVASSISLKSEKKEEARKPEPKRIEEEEDDDLLF